MSQRSNVLHFVTHGHAFKGKKTLTYRAWEAMVQRTTNPMHKSFEHYANIPVDPSFLGRGGFKAYLAAVGERPSLAHTLDRIVPERGYVPGNLRWASKQEQAQNITRRVFYGRTVEDWARTLGVRPTTIRKRLERGWNDDRMFPADLRAAPDVRAVA